MTTRSISETMTQVADRSAVIATTIAQFAKAARLTAYAGTRARAAAGDLSHTSESLRSIVATFTVGEHDDQPANTPFAVEASTAWRDGMTTVVPSDAHGNGVNEFHYVGLWSHDKGSAATDANSYSCVIGDSASLLFDGTAIELFGIADSHHGIVSVTLDDEPATLADMYSSERRVGMNLYRRDGLRSGRHEVTGRVTGERHPSSRFHWAAITRAVVR